MKYSSSVSCLLAALVLVACGGGSGESAAATGGSSAGGSASSGASSSASGSASGNTGGSAVQAGGTGSTGQAVAGGGAGAAAEAAALALATVNAERERCGFGTVQRHAALDTAAGWHAAYLQQRLNQGGAPSHTEDPALSGFQGVSFADRATRAGYGYAALGEYLSFAPLGGSAEPGDALVRAMLATVYHLVGMLDGNRDVGISVAFADQAPAGWQQAILDWETGTPRGSRPYEPGVLLTYPCAGSTGVQPYMYGEVPDPFAGLGFAAGPGVGQPIYLRAPAGSRILLAAATLTSAGGKPVPVQLYHATDDPQRQLGAHQAFVIPREPLEEGGRYTAQVQGTVDGVPFSRDFVFGTLRF